VIDSNDIRPLNPLESALPQTLHLKPFRIRTYRKVVGGGCKLLTSYPAKQICPERALIFRVKNLFREPDVALFNEPLFTSHRQGQLRWTLRRVVK